ncbi:hypothetical protein ACQ86N_39030 [Puia sp. P3]|uniref:class III lanthionine synthetase LanKC N-terminal domain-containing protein n=1 Tax=Puia sp. P3 TaxID=3423952 RepID=UPI003D66E875
MPHSTRQCVRSMTMPVLRIAGIFWNPDPSHSLQRARICKIGNIEEKPSWVLYVSVIKTELIQLLQDIVPALSSAGVAFKIPESKDVAKRILDGGTGNEKVGKIICIYPKEDELARIAKLLIPLTIDTKGPSVPNARLLGGSVYAAYDPLQSPLPNRIDWPFDDISPETPPRENCS